MLITFNPKSNKSNKNFHEIWNCVRIIIEQTLIYPYFAICFNL